MASVNRVFLLGNVGADPEVRYIGDRNAKDATMVAHIRIATTTRYKDNSGQYKEETDWHNVTAWRSLASLCEKYVKKGSQLFIEGHIKPRKYTDNTNTERYTVELVADNIQLIGGKPQGNDPYIKGAQQVIRQTPAAAQPAPAAAPDMSNDEPVTDDLPF